MSRLDLRRAGAEARALFARDHDLLLRIAGVFLFLPSFAGLLFLPPAVAQKGQTANQVLLAWFADNVHWLALEQAVLALGGATLYRLYLGAAPTPGDALRGAAVRYLPFAMASLLAMLAVVAGLALLILPGAYLLGRTALTGPAVVAEERGALAALERSVTATAGHGRVLFGVQGLLLAAGQLTVVVLGALDPGDKGVGSALAAAGAAAAGAATILATILFKIAAWRQLGSSTGT